MKLAILAALAALVAVPAAAQTSPTCNFGPLSPPAPATHQAATITVQMNGVCIASGPAGLRRVAVSPPRNGTLTFPDSGGIRYEPHRGFVGSDAFTYEIGARTITANVVVQRESIAATAPAVNSWPECQVDRFSVGGVATGAADPTFNANAATPAMRLRRGGTCSVAILGPRLSISVVTPPSNGTARIEGQRVHYDPRPGFAGDDTFTVRMFAPDRSQNSAAFLTFRVQVRDATPSAAVPPPTPPASQTSVGTPAPQRQATPAPRAPQQATRPAEPPAQPASQPQAATPAAPPQSRAPAAAAQPAPRPDVAARLRQLQQLRDQNLITEEEYRSRRQAIIDAL